VKHKLLPVSTAPPQLVARTLIAILLTVAALLAVVFMVLTFDTRDRVRRSVADRLETEQRVIAALEQRRELEVLAHVATLAENPTLKAALDTYETEIGMDGEVAAQLTATMQRELDKIGRAVGGDVVALTDRRGVTLVSTGLGRDLWPAGAHVPVASSRDPADSVIHLPTGVFRLVVVPLNIDGHFVGNLFRATGLDTAFARELATLAQVQVAIVGRRQVVASTLPAPEFAELGAVLGAATADQGTVSLAGEQLAFQRLLTFRDGTAVFALQSVAAAAEAATGQAYRALASIGLMGLVLGSLASLWLARTLTRPINDLSSSVAMLAKVRQPGSLVPLSANSRELDVLTSSFNDLMRSLDVAEADTRAAYVGVIAALASALDARDPYTAGHSQRVSAVAVVISRQLHLPDEMVEIVRLGAVLHDVGKIGVPDAILGKPGRLTSDEYESIKLHPALGARILRPVAFLLPHLPIVEFHHERPDGKGYPHGLAGNDIPLAARIVHVADAFDAMTNARAYRPALSHHEAIDELRRHRGTDFDGDVVDAFLRCCPDIGSLTHHSSAA